MSCLQQVTVLGATGSVGLSALDVIARHPERYQVFALTGFSRLSELLALCVRHAPRFAHKLADALKHNGQVLRTHHDQRHHAYDDKF